MAKKKNIDFDEVLEKNTKPFIDFNLHPEYYSIDFNEYFDKLKAKGNIKKNTFTILYHPMNLLIGKYENLLERNCKKINITNNHMLLLSYFMGFTGGDIVHKSCVYWGSNKTIANDLGVSSRTIQRWIGDLARTGFIAIVRQFETERYVYINYSLIVKRMNDLLKTSKKKISISRDIKSAVAYFEKLGYVSDLNKDACINYLCAQEQLKEAVDEKMDFEMCLLLLSEKFKLNTDEYRIEFDKATEAYKNHFGKEKN